MLRNVVIDLRKIVGTNAPQKEAMRTAGVIRTYMQGTLANKMEKYGDDIRQNILERMENSGIKRHSGRLERSIKVSKAFTTPDFTAVGVANYPEMNEITSIFTKTVAALGTREGFDKPINRKTLQNLVNKRISPESYMPPRSYGNVTGYWFFLEKGFEPGIRARAELDPYYDWWDTIFKARIGGGGGMTGKHFLHTASGKVHSSDVDVFRHMQRETKGFVIRRMQHMVRNLHFKYGKTHFDVKVR